jgi:hypothetical protein
MTTNPRTPGLTDEQIWHIVNYIRALDPHAIIR